MSLINLPEIPKFVDKACENLTSTLTSNVGNTFADIWYLVFGGISHAADKRKMKYAHNLKLFQESLEQKIEQIPLENRREPDMEIVAPALEASKYYLTHEKIRQMFENLIAGNLDELKYRETHPAFTYIIQEMSQLDAVNLSLFSGMTPLPICELRSVNKTNKAYDTLYTNFFIQNQSETDVDKQCESISLLARLGLISVHYDNHLSLEGWYDSFYETQLYLSLKQKVELSETQTLKLKKGAVILTPFGMRFKNICLP